MNLHERVWDAGLSECLSVSPGGEPGGLRPDPRERLSLWALVLLFAGGVTGNGLGGAV